MAFTPPPQPTAEAPATSLLGASSGEQLLHLSIFSGGADGESVFFGNLAALWGSCWGVVLAAVLLWLVVELLFYLWFVVELRRAQVPVTPPRLSLEDRDFMLNKMLLHAEDYGMWRQIQGWFLTKDRDGTHSPHEVGSEDLIELLAWAFFYKRVEDLDAEETAWVQLARRKIFEDFKLDSSVRPGRSGVLSVRHTLDKIHAIHRPLLFYAAVQLMYACHGLLLRFRGFRRGHHRGLWYWYRLPSRQHHEHQRSEAQGHLADATGEGGGSPLLEGEPEVLAFFHGIGLGLLLYLPLLLRINLPDQILFEMPWISMDPFAPIPSSTDYARWVAEALQSHGVHRCVAMGHSYGSLPIAWLVRQFPSQITRCILIDPVAIFLNLPDVCVNFLYKQPRSLYGWLMQLFGAREFGIAKTLMRHFFWTDNVLFPEMLPVGSSVILMGNDRLLPVKDIYTCSAKLSKLRTVVLPGLDHGHFLIKPSAVTTILEHMEGPQQGSAIKK